MKVPAFSTINGGADGSHRGAEVIGLQRPETGLAFIAAMVEMMVAPRPRSGMISLKLSSAQSPS